MDDRKRVQQGFLKALSADPDYAGWTPDEIRGNVNDVLTSDNSSRISSLFTSLKAVPEYEGWNDKEIEEDIRSFWDFEVPKATPKPQSPTTDLEAPRPAAASMAPPFNADPREYKSEPKRAHESAARLAQMAMKFPEQFRKTIMERGYPSEVIRDDAGNIVRLDYARGQDPLHASITMPEAGVTATAPLIPAPEPEPTTPEEIAKRKEDEQTLQWDLIRQQAESLQAPGEAEKKRQTEREKKAGEAIKDYEERGGLAGNVGRSIARGALDIPKSFAEISEQAFGVGGELANDIRQIQRSDALRQSKLAEMDWGDMGPNAILQVLDEAATSMTSMLPGLGSIKTGRMLRIGGKAIGAAEKSLATARAAGKLEDIAAAEKALDRAVMLRDALLAMPPNAVLEAGGQFEDSAVKYDKVSGSFRRVDLTAGQKMLALGSGAASAVFETVADVKLFKRLDDLIDGAVADAVKREALKQSLGERLWSISRSAAQVGGGQAATEAGTEFVQELITGAAKNAGLGGDASVKELLENAVKAAVIGGVAGFTMGAIPGGIKHAAHKRQEEKSAEPKEAEGKPDRTEQAVRPGDLYEDLKSKLKEQSGIVDQSVVIASLPDLQAMKPAERNPIATELVGRLKGDGLVDADGQIITGKEATQPEETRTDEAGMGQGSPTPKAPVTETKAEPAPPIPPAEPAQEGEETRAQSVRSDEGQVPPGGAVVEGGQEQGGPNIQQPTPEQPRDTGQPRSGEVEAETSARPPEIAAATPATPQLGVVNQATGKPIPESAEVQDEKWAKRRQAGEYVDEMGRKHTRVQSFTPNDDRVAWGGESNVAFTKDLSVPVQYGVVEADLANPSHLEGRPNPRHFKPEAQPKNRAQSESNKLQSRAIADRFNPRQIIYGENAFAGAPVVDMQNDVIQGNGREDAQRLYWKLYPEDPKGFRQAIVDAAPYLGLSPEAVEKIKTMKAPIVRRFVNSTEGQSITLGQYGVEDMESVATRATQATKAARKLSDSDVLAISTMLEGQDTGALDEPLGEMIQRVGFPILDRLFASEALDPDKKELYYGRDGKISPDGVAGIRDLLTGILFRGGDTNIPELFRKTPEAFQKAIERTVPHLLTAKERIDEDMQNAILIHHGWVRSGLGAVTDFISQPSLTDGVAPIDRMGARAAAIAQMMTTASQREQTAKLKQYARNTVGSSDMFGTVEPMPKEEAFQSAFGRYYDDVKRYAVEGKGNRFFAAPGEADLSALEPKAEYTPRREGRAAVLDLLKTKADLYVEDFVSHVKENPRISDAEERKAVYRRNREIASQLALPFAGVLTGSEEAGGAGGVLPGGAVSRGSGRDQSQNVRRPTPTVLALGIAEEYQAHGVAELLGKKIRTVRDLALISQIYRDPRFETLRYIFVKDGKVVEHTGVSSRIPGAASIFLPGYSQDTAGLSAFLNDMKRRFNFDKMYLVHNHPSGNATPSSEDVNITSLFEDAMGADFGGHVVIDSGEYAVIRRRAVMKANIPIARDELLMPSKPHPVLGVKAASVEAVVEIGRQFQKPGWVTIVGLNTQLEVRTISEMPKEDLMAMVEEEAREFFMDQAERHGAGRVALVGFDNVARSGGAPVWARQLLADGILLDVIDMDGFSAAETAFMNPPQKESPQIRMDQRNAYVAEGPAEYVATNTKAYDILYKIAGFYAEKGLRDPGAFARLMQLKLGDKLASYPAEMQKAISDAIAYFADSTVDIDKLTRRQLDELIQQASEDNKRGDSEDTILRVSLRKGNEPGTVRGTDSGRSGAAAPGTVATVGAGGRPGIRVLDEGHLPQPGTHVRPEQYDVDDVQILGINLALTRFIDKAEKSFLLADGTGVGKTREELVIAREMALRTKKPTLIVTYDDKTVDVFRREADALGFPLEASNIEIGTYTDLTAGKKAQKNGGAPFAQRDYGLVVFDESQRIKNLTSKRSQVSREVKAKHRLYATATPMDKPVHAAYFLAEITGQPVEDVAGSLGFDLVEGPEGLMPVLQENIDWDQVLDNIVAMRRDAVKAGAMVRREYPFFGEIRRELLKLSPNQNREMERIYTYWSALYAQAKDRTATLFRNAREAYLSRRMNRHQYMQEIQKISRSKNFAKNPLRKSLHESAVGRLREISAWTEAQKTEEVVRRVRQAMDEGKRPIVYAESVNDPILEALDQKPGEGPARVPGFLTTLEERLRQAGIETARLYGEGDKLTEARRFQTGVLKVALATPQSGGVGISLDDTGGNEPRIVFVVTPNYAGDITDQVMGRVSRRNTKSPSEIVFLYAPESPSDRNRGRILGQKLGALRRIQAGEDPNRALFQAPTPEETQSSPEVKPRTPGSITITPYRNNTVLVHGDTYANREKLKRLGGSYNGALRGWIMPRTAEVDVRTEFAGRIADETQGQLQVKEGSVPYETHEAQVEQEIESVRAQIAGIDTRMQGRIFDDGSRMSPLDLANLSDERRRLVDRLQYLNRRGIFEARQRDETVRRSAGQQLGMFSEAELIGQGSLFAVSSSVKRTAFSVAKVQTAIRPVLQKFARIPDETVIVLPTINSLPAGAHPSMNTQAKGVYFTLHEYPGAGKVRIYLIADQIEDAGDAVRTLLHETAGHYGLRSMLGKSFDETMDGIWRDYEAEIRKQAWFPDYRQQKNYDPNTLDGRRNLAEEYLAFMAQEGDPNPSLWKRVWEAIRTWISSWDADYAKRFTEGDARELVAMSYAYLRHGPPDVAARGRGSRFLYAGRRSATYRDVPMSRKFYGRYDQKRRYEVDDSKVELRAPYDKAMNLPWNTTLGIPLGSILDHPELYRAYPSIAEIRIAQNPWISGALFNWSKARIEVGREASGDILKASLLHEVQHAIQDIEGFASGGSPKHPKVRDRAMSELLEKVTDKIDDEMVNEAAYKWYSRLAGEIEARDVAQRSQGTTSRYENFDRARAIMEDVHAIHESPEWKEEIERFLKEKGSGRRTDDLIGGADFPAHQRSLDLQRSIGDLGFDLSNREVLEALRNNDRAGADAMPPYSSEDIAPGDALVLPDQQVGKNNSGPRFLLPLRQETAQAQNRVKAILTDRSELNEAKSDELAEKHPWLKAISRKSRLVELFSPSLEQARQTLMMQESYVKAALSNEGAALVDRFYEMVKPKDQRTGWEKLDWLFRIRNGQAVRDFFRLSIPLAAHLNVQRVDPTTGDFVFEAFDMRAGFFSDRDLARMERDTGRTFGTGDEIEVTNRLLTEARAIEEANNQGLERGTNARRDFVKDLIDNQPVVEKVRLGDRIKLDNGREGYQLIRSVDPAVQEELYNLFADEFPHMIWLIDYFINPTLRNNTRVIHGVRIPVFNRYSMAEFMKLDDPHFEELKGYTPDVAFNRSVLGAVKSIALGIRRGTRSPGRKYKTGTARESGNVRDIMSAFNIRAFQVLRERQRKAFAQMVFKEAVPITDRAAIPEGWVDFQTGIKELADAIQKMRELRFKPVSRQLSSQEYADYDTGRKPLPKGAIGLDPQTQSILIRPFFETYQRMTKEGSVDIDASMDLDFKDFYQEAMAMKGSRLMIPRRVLNIVLESYSTQRVQNGLVRKLQWLIRNSTALLLVDPKTYLQNIGTNDLFAMEAATRSAMSGLMKLAAKRNIADEDLRRAAYTFGTAIRGRFKWLIGATAGSRRMEKRIGEILPNEIFSDNNMLRDVGVNSAESAYDALMRGEIGAAVLQAIRYGNIDIRAKQRYAYAYLMARGRTQGVAQGLSGDALRQSVETYMQSPPDADRTEAIRAANFEFLNYANSPEVLERFARNDLYRLILPFPRFGYHFLMKQKDGIKALFTFYQGKTGDEKIEALAQGMATTLFNLGLGGLAISMFGMGDDDEPREWTGSSESLERTEEGTVKRRPLEPDLITANRIKLPAVIANWLRYTGFGDNEEEFWVRVRSYPAIAVTAIGAQAFQDARRYGPEEGFRTFFNAGMDLSTDFFNVGAGIRVPGKVAQQILGLNKNPADPYSSYVPLAYYGTEQAMQAFLPGTRQVEHVIHFVDPVMRRRTASKTLDYNQTIPEQVLNAIRYGHVTGLASRILEQAEVIEPLPPTGKIQNVAVKDTKNTSKKSIPANEARRKAALGLIGTRAANTYQDTRTGRERYAYVEGGRTLTPAEMVSNLMGFNIRGYNRGRYKEAIQSKD